jgi:hypothetical protein
LPLLRGCCAAAARLPCWLGLLAFAFASRCAVRAVTRVYFVMLAAMAAVIVA